MRKHKYILISIVTFIAVIIFHGFTAESYAIGVSMPPNSSATSPGFNAPPPYIVPTTQPPWFPHSFPYLWSADDVVAEFRAQSLEVVDPEQITETDRYGLPAKPDQLIRFLMPSVSDDVQGCILSFELKDNLKKIKEYYADLNAQGHPYTWSFVKDNILFVIDGAVPEERARQYESALRGLKQKE